MGILVYTILSNIAPFVEHEKMPEALYNLNTPPLPLLKQQNKH